MATVPTITLNNGVEIPQLGFGVFQIPPDETVEATRDGARDRLPAHRHRADVRQREGGRRRPCASPASTASEVFVTSKLNNNRLERDDILRSFDQTLEALGFDQLDLFLIHWPLPGRQRLRRPAGR